MYNLSTRSSAFVPLPVVLQYSGFVFLGQHSVCASVSCLAFARFLLATAYFWPLTCGFEFGLVRSFVFERAKAFLPGLTRLVGRLGVDAPGSAMLSCRAVESAAAFTSSHNSFTVGNLGSSKLKPSWVYHGAVKPENILFKNAAPNHLFQLSEFDVSQPQFQYPGRDTTAFMAPELVMSGN
ncbi:hypothetical protein NQ176_g8007 [Zarea fungicola]|uniref:Uncharacterized protein n=1 Tax=Zarea fungicola TaxID=93591 RepID=A0ACC1MWB1_9HYPO|nr:hypothetical protein NQ176_g8007 [Lecanicillium fungicola]